MSAGEELASGAASASPAVEPLKVFISYRRSDSGAYGLLLHDKLAAKFGKDNVFLDVKAIGAGKKWLEEIRSRGSECRAFLALIGSKWVETLAERAQKPEEEDFVRAEIELAVRATNRGSPMVIIPVLLDDATMPSQQQVPQSMWPLLSRETARIRAEHCDSDIQALIEAVEQAKPEPVESPPSRRPEPPPRARRARPASGARAPDDDHYDEVVDAINDGEIVIFLGPGANSSDRQERWAEGASGYLPDGDELAAYLADKFDIEAEPAVLARVAQYVAVAEGPGDLYRILRTTLAPHPEPTSAHKFLAGLPGLLHERGLEEKHQLIVTTNYDNALEQAFTDAEEPFDLAVYMSKEGKFAHFPFDDEPTEIDRGKANEYNAFPIDPLSREVARTVIVKIHGAVDREQGPVSWQDNYVITEDDYIGYLSDASVDAVVPSQIKNVLWYNHLLFLGYTMRDWNLRVFLQRMFTKREKSTSWAIQSDPDRLDERFWRRIGVDLYGIPLADYLREIDAHLVP